MRFFSMFWLLYCSLLQAQENRFFHCIQIDLPEHQLSFNLLQSSQQWQLHQQLEPLPMDVFSTQMNELAKRECLEPQKIKGENALRDQIDQIIDQSRSQNPIIQNRLFFLFKPIDFERLQSLLQHLFKVKLSIDAELNQKINLSSIEIRQMKRSRVRSTRKIKTLDFQPLAKLLEIYQPAQELKANGLKAKMLKLILDFRHWHSLDQQNQKDLGILQTLIFERLVAVENDQINLDQINDLEALKHCSSGDLLAQQTEKAIHQPFIQEGFIVIRGYQSCFFSYDLLWYDWSIDLSFHQPIEALQIDLSFFEKAFGDITLFPLLSLQQISALEMIDLMKIGPLIQINQRLLAKHIPAQTNLGIKYQAYFVHADRNGQDQTLIQSSELKKRKGRKINPNETLWRIQELFQSFKDH